jgi:hypothetical protein
MRRGNSSSSRHQALPPANDRARAAHSSDVKILIEAEIRLQPDEEGRIVKGEWVDEQPGCCF